MDAENQANELSEKLESLDIEELKDLRKTVDRDIASYETRKRQEAISAAEQAAVQVDASADRPAGAPGRTSTRPTRRRSLSSRGAA